MGVRVTKQSTKYNLEVDDLDIYVEVFSDGEVSIKTHNEKNQFQFTNSEPDTVEGIAKLLLEAAKLGQEALKEADTDE